MGEGLSDADGSWCTLGHDQSRITEHSKASDEIYFVLYL